MRCNPLLSRIPIFLLLYLGMSLFLTPTSLAQPQSYLFGTTERDGEDWFWRMDVDSEEFEYVKKMPETINGLRVMPQILSAIDLFNKLYLMWGTTSAETRLLMFDLETGDYVRSTNRKLGLGRLTYVNPQDGLLRYMYINFPESRGEITSVDPATGDVDYLGVRESVNSTWANGHQYDYSRGLMLLMSREHGWQVYDVNSAELVADYDIRIDFDNVVHDPVSGYTYGLIRVGSGESQTITLNRFNPETGDLEQTATLDFDGTIRIGPAALDVERRRLIFSAGDGGIVQFNMDGTLWSHSEHRELKKWSAWNIYSQVNFQTRGVRVEGHVYVDKDADCVGESTDMTMSRIRLGFEPTSFAAWSGTNGRFVQYLQPGDYNVNFSQSHLWTSNCENNPLTITVPEKRDSVLHLDYVLDITTPIDQLDVSVIASRAILGRDFRYTIEYVNSGNVPFTGAVRLCFDERLEFLSATPAENRRSDSMMEWDVNDLPIGAAATIVVDFKVPADESLRDQTICAQLKTRGKTREDLLLKYSRDELCMPLQGSLDPNDISVAPAGFGTGGQIFAEDSTLAYMIRFQNIGGAPAFDVVIRDTLDPNMDLQTLQFGAAMHDYTVSVIEGDVLEFRFEGIELPGREEDEPNSHGAVKYKIDLKKDLPEGTQIHNRAAIYFDFNKPVITNTVVNTISESITDVNEINFGTALADKLELRSLGQGRFVCRLNTGENSPSQPQASQPLSGKLQVFSVLGSKVFETTLSGETEVSVDLGSQPGGRYLIRLENAGRTYFGSVAVLR